MKNKGGKNVGYDNRNPTIKYDKSRTIKNVSRFFGNPRDMNCSSEFQDLLDLAHLQPGDLLYSSPVINDMPTAAPVGNMAEVKLMRHTDKMFQAQDAAEILAGIANALTNMPGEYGRVIVLRHFAQRTMFEIADVIGYSNSQTARLLNNAYWRFALWVVDTIDLRVPMKQTI